MRLRRGIATTMGATLTAGLVLAAPPAVAGGGGSHCPEATYYGEASGDSGVVELEYSCFTPTVLYVAPGTEVVFQNKDPLLHNLSGPRGGFAGGLFEDLEPRSELGFTFDDEGVFPYMCYLHPGMSGAIVVGEGRARGDVVEIEDAKSDRGSEEGAEAIALDAGSAASKDGGPGTAPLLLGLGIALVLLIAAVASLASRRARPASSL